MTDSSLAHLAAHLAALVERVRLLVQARRSVDPAPDDPFRGLYVTDEHADLLLRRPDLPGRIEPGPARPAPGDRKTPSAEAADRAEAAGERLRLRDLCRGFDLDGVDRDILLIALGPDLDPRLEQLYGYLHDDVTRRRAGVGLALELAGLSPLAGADRRRVVRGPLARGALLEVAEEERPFLTRSLRVPDRVTAHLLGDDTPDPVVEPFLLSASARAGPAPTQLVRALAAGAPVHLRERPGASGVLLAAAALEELGREAVAVDASALAADTAETVVRSAVREARLRGAGLVVRGLEPLVASRSAMGVLAAAPVPTVLVGRDRWDPRWSEAVPTLLDVAPPPAPERAHLWRSHLDGHLAPAVDPVDETRHFTLAPEQVERAAVAARGYATAEGVRVQGPHLRAGARAQNAGGLESLARRIEPAVGWDDLVLPPGPLAGLRELSDRARHREQVLGTWGMRPGAGRGRGITALFAGDSGTGKTMSAEVIAADLGLDLYAVNLATVVDKYVGETEKNLERIFSEADGVNAVLLFDEADALFGRRSEVRDAHDRYANIEVAYLLQRLETFDGLAILATNLRANVDDAFARRLDTVVDFPVPDEAHRLRLWDRCLGPAVPRADDLDLAFCARQFEVSGGNIRSIATTAAYLTAAQQRPLCMADLVRAVQREYRKLGRLCVRAEFGPWLERVP
ncbi:ATP-binding protein [Motilibacter deserti]|uniref:ATP-binding protein n=1 Tax=Motilibacter deserti TaxID=2714956 RepID=A0ABX0GSF0_9ACTN|nr:ATP-binding protein [Motilibacter deserti]